jgi:DNA anti-recombination protein RmuC
MTATEMRIAFAGGVVAGPVIVMVATQGLSVNRPQIQDRVQHIDAIFAHPPRAAEFGEIVLERLLDASDMARHGDFEVQALLSGCGRSDVVF